MSPPIPADRSAAGRIPIPGCEPDRAGPDFFHGARQIGAETIGNVAGIRSCQPPFAICIAIGFIPAAWTAISTWPDPGCGLGNSVTAGLAPYSLTVIARMIASLLVSGL
ncbi:MAG TPA: hypothetical protein VIY52_35460 [Streptosporangiaceae bacterium]